MGKDIALANRDDMTVLMDAARLIRKRNLAGDNEVARMLDIARYKLRSLLIRQPDVRVGPNINGLIFFGLKISDEIVKLLGGTRDGD